MKWNVFIYNVNQREIETYGIFRHSGFSKDIAALIKKKQTKEVFAEQVRRISMYYFWARCEFEVLIMGFPPSPSDDPRKVDIYEQIMLNFDIFVDYIWACSHRKVK